MKKYTVTIKSFNECLIHSQHDKLEDAEYIRKVLEKYMPGAKVEVNKADIKDEKRQ